MRHHNRPKGRGTGECSAFSLPRGFHRPGQSCGSSVNLLNWSRTCVGSGAHPLTTVSSTPGSQGPWPAHSGHSSLCLLLPIHLKQSFSGFSSARVLWPRLVVRGGCGVRVKPVAPWAPRSQLQFTQCRSCSRRSSAQASASRSPQAVVMHDLPGAWPARTGTPAPRSPPGTRVPTWGEASAAHPSAQVGGAGRGGLGSAPRSPSPLKAAEGRVWTLLGIRVVGSVTPAQQDIFVSPVPSCGPGTTGHRLWAGAAVAPEMRLEVPPEDPQVQPVPRRPSWGHELKEHLSARSLRPRRGPRDTVQLSGLCRLLLASHCLLHFSGLLFSLLPWILDHMLGFQMFL